MHLLSRMQIITLNHTVTRLKLKKNPAVFVPLEVAVRETRGAAAKSGQ